MKFLQGYKTYITAAASVLGALAAYVSGDVELAPALQLIITSILAVTLRSGIKAND